MNIRIFGLGYVGCVSMGCLAKMGHNIIGVDKSEVKVEQTNLGKATIIEDGIDDLIKDGYADNKISATLNSYEAIIKTDLSIIAVGTPSDLNGHLNMNYIYEAAEEIGIAIKDKKDYHEIVIRSTILPGTCEKVEAIIENNSGKKKNENFSVIANPEFLREGTAIKDYFNPPLILVGSNNRKYALKIISLYEDIKSELIVEDRKTIEIMKYVNNTFHALKISFANEVGNICKSLDIDSRKVMELLVKDKQLNISSYYLKPGFAYGGSCLPKDLKGFQSLAHENNIKVPIIASINKTNTIQTERALQLICSLKKKKVLMIGLSFKSNTDDLRNSPYVELAERLIGKGYDISIYDENVYISNIQGTNKVYIDEHVPHLSKLLIDSIDDYINDTDIIIVSHNINKCNKILSKHQNKIIIDLVGLDDEVIKMHSNYYGINW